MQISIPSPRAGLLSIAVQERGISVTAAIVGASGPIHQAASPIDRLGTITLVRPVGRGESVQVRVASIDSPDISAKVRISARLLPPGSTRARARRLLAAADEATQDRNWQSAFEDLLQASRLLRYLGLHADVAAAHQEMAELAYGYLQRDRDSIALIATALSDATVTDPAILGTRVVLLAKALMGLPQLSAAMGHRARNLLQVAAGSLRASSLGLRELPRLVIIEGFLEYRDGRLRVADGLFNRAAADCKALGDWECYAQARQNFAVLAEQQQNYPAALNAFEQALSPLDAKRMPLLAADISSNLARLEGRIGLFRRSARAQERAMRLYAGLGQCDRVRRSASSLGGMLVEVGSVSNAVGYLKQAATLSCPQLLGAAQHSDVTNSPFAASGAADPSDDGGNDLGAALTRRASGPGAICLQPTFEGTSQIDRVAVFQALLYLGEVAKADNHLDAEGLCLAAARRYSVDDRTQVRLINASGELELARQRPRFAQRDFHRALRLTRASALTEGTQYQGVTEIDLAEAALALGHPARAWSHAYAALRLSSARADVTHVVTSLRLLALSDAASGRRILATRTLRAAVGLIEQVPTGELNAAQRAMYLATQYSTFADLTDLLVGTTHTSGIGAWRAFAVAEQGHARSLRYAMTQAARERAATPVERGSADYRTLLRTLAAAAKHASGSSGTGLLNEITQLTLPTATVSTPVDRRALASQLRHLRATLVEYVVGRRDMLAFVTDGTEMHVARLGSRAKIAAAATTLSERLGSAEQVPFEIRAAARKLARLILWPIRSSLNRRRIIFVPDGTLYKVPFNILPWTKARSSALVLQHAQVSEEPSAILLTEHAGSVKHPVPGQHFVLIGDPVLRDNEWYRSCDGHAQPKRDSAIPRAIKTAFAWSRLLPTLPGTRAEVLAVSRIIHRSRPSAHVKALLGCAATPRALRETAASAAVLHVATHGIVDARRPRLSALALTPDPPSGTDAAFRLLDILRLPLHAQLVVLSACDTSRGRVLPGEGVLGLAQAFLQAGAKSVVASYWRVQDAATVQFMESFYRNLLVHDLSVAAALRRTQLELAARSGSYSWAAFGVYGRPNVHP